MAWIAVAAAVIVSGARFQPYENLWKWSFIKADGTVKPQGTWSDKLTIDKGVGRRTQEQRLADGRTIVTMNVFDLATLRPLERDWRAFDGRFTHITFHGRDLERTAVRKAGAPATTERAALTEDVYDFNGGYGLMTFWLSDEPPYIIKLTFPMQGGLISYEMV